MMFMVLNRAIQVPILVAAGLVITGLSLASCAATDPLPGHVRASSEVEASVRKTLEEYYVLRGQAAVTGDTAPLYRRHPRLAAGEDRTKGINLEAFFVERIQAFNRETSGPRATGVIFEFAASEPLRVYVKEDVAVAFVQGLETWVAVGTKAGIRVRFELRRDSDRWTIEGTDEQLLSERPPATPAR